MNSNLFGMEFLHGMVAQMVEELLSSGRSVTTDLDLQVRHGGWWFWMIPM